MAVLNQALQNLSEKQVNQEFGIPHNSLRISRTSGVLWGQQAPSYIKIGHRVLYKRKVIEDWFAQFESVNNTTQAKLGA